MENEEEVKKKTEDGFEVRGHITQIKPPELDVKQSTLEPELLLNQESVEDKSEEDTDEEESAENVEPKIFPPVHPSTLEEDEVISFPRLYQDVKEFLNKHVDLVDDRYYSLLTSWVFSTYQTERVPCTPHLHIIGAKGTGKTRLLEALKAVVYRGYIPIAMTAASLYYLVTLHQPTLLLDEAQIYSNEDHATLRVLLSVYRKGQSVPRVRYDAKEKRVEHYSPYGFKSYASLSELPENIADRCLQIRMQPAEKKISRTINEKQAQKLRNSLHYYSNVPLRKIPEQLWQNMAIDNRLSELFETLLLNTPNDGAIDAFNSEGGYKIGEPDQSKMLCRQDTLNLFSLMNELNKEKNKQKTESIEAEILREFQSQASASKDSWASTTAVSDMVNKRNHDFADQTNPTQVAAVLKQAGFKQKRKAASRGFMFAPATFRRLAKQYGLTPTVAPLKPQMTGTNPSPVTQPVTAKLPIK